MAVVFLPAVATGPLPIAFLDDAEEPSIDRSFSGNCRKGRLSAVIRPAGCCCVVRRFAATAYIHGFGACRQAVGGRAFLAICAIGRYTPRTWRDSTTVGRPRRTMGQPQLLTPRA